MTDSNNRPPRDNDKAAVLARLENAVRAQDKQDPSELPRWVKTALVFQAIEGTSHKDTAEKLGRNPTTYSNYVRSPAAKKWLEGLSKFLDDPVAMAKAYMGSNALNVTLDRFMFLEAAIAAGDYKEGDKIAKDLQDRMGIIAKKTGEGGALTVNVKFGGASFEAPVVEAEWELEGGEEEDA